MAEKRRNPKWSRDELILALSTYLNLRGHFTSGSSDSRVQQLSVRLNQLEKPPGVEDQAKFRNPNGTYMKLMNFRRFDPEYTSQGKSGLTNGGKQEEEIWNEFFNNPTGLEEAVRSIKSGEAIYAQSTWIFQGNPDIFNVNAYLEEQFAAEKPINWVVRQHRSKVKTWDLVYIWRSAGKLRAESGVVASDWRVQRSQQTYCPGRSRNQEQATNHHYITARTRLQSRSENHHPNPQRHNVEISLNQMSTFSVVNFTTRHQLSHPSKGIWLRFKKDWSPRRESNP